MCRSCAHQLQLLFLRKSARHFAASMRKQSEAQDMLAAIYMDKCIQIGRRPLSFVLRFGRERRIATGWRGEAMQLLTQLILGPMVNLQRLDISGVYVSIAESCRN